MYYSEASLAVIKALEFWGIKHVYGVTGGGCLDITKHLPPYVKKEKNISFFNLAEYVAGFAPIGNFIASAEIACVVTVTGAAAKLSSCGLSDARFLRIPALYLMSLNKKTSENQTPLQDVGCYGMNWLAQVRQELKADVAYLENVEDLPKCLEQIATSLSEFRPTAFCFHSDEIKKPIDMNCIPPLLINESFEKEKCDKFLSFLNQSVEEKKNIYLYVCAEAVYDTRNYQLIKKFQNQLNAQVVCSVNGAYACVDLPNFAGHVGIGGHLHINKIWKNLSSKDVLIIMGAELGDYHFFNPINDVSSVWMMSNRYRSYGFINESYQHRFKNQFHLLKGPLYQTLNYLTKKNIPKSNIIASHHFEEFKEQNVALDKVNLLDFYQKIDLLWKKNTLCFEDVCSAYRDRQFVLPIPNSRVQFFSSQDGSAMGGALGICVGAKMASPQKHCFVFMGDGCSRLVFGTFPELANLGIVVFVLNNQSFGLIDEYYQKQLNNLESTKYHIQLAAMDFVAAANACFWDAYRLNPDLSNLEILMNKAYSTKRSILIEIPCESFQELGFNPRRLILK